MKALISPIEAREIGVRVAQVEAEEFEVALPLYWTECPDEVTPEWTYDNGEFVPPPAPSNPEPLEE